MILSSSSSLLDRTAAAIDVYGPSYGPFLALLFFVSCYDRSGSDIDRIDLTRSPDPRLAFPLSLIGSDADLRDGFNSWD